MRKTKGVSVFPVAFSGNLAVEGPVCENGKAVRWIAAFAPQRYASSFHTVFVEIPYSLEFSRLKCFMGQSMAALPQN